MDGHATVVLKLKGFDVDAFSFVDLPSLKTLHLNDIGFLKPQCLMEILYGCPNLEYMHVSTIFYVDSCTPRYKKVETLSKLVRANIHAIGLDIPLKTICNVEFLRIDKYLDGFPIFPNLTHVELMFGTHMNWHLVLAMLKQCTKLQNFAIDMQKSSTDMVWISPSNDPECLYSQLRKCSITNYQGKKSEQHFAKFILQNSTGLQTMTICTAPSSKLEDKFEMIKELSLCPRTSPICQLSFK